ncbi:MAG: hypothetical protein SF029_16820 [bacterium]|nr:hypothetical protein [bacterium]
MTEIHVLLLTLIVTIVGVVYAGNQLHLSRRVSQGEFLLHLDEMMRVHDKVHRSLRPGGKWAKGNVGPINADEWADVESYMGLFERIKILIDRKILDIKLFDRLYGYRIDNIIANEVIVQTKLGSEEKESWQDFIALHRALEQSRKGK